MQPHCLSAVSGPCPALLVMGASTFLPLGSGLHLGLGAGLKAPSAPGWAAGSDGAAGPACCEAHCPLFEGPLAH